MNAIQTTDLFPLMAFLMALVNAGIMIKIARRESRPTLYFAIGAAFVVVASTSLYLISGVGFRVGLITDKTLALHLLRASLPLLQCVILGQGIYILKTLRGVSRAF